MYRQIWCNYTLPFKHSLLHLNVTFCNIRINMKVSPGCLELILEHVMKYDTITETRNLIENSPS